MLETLRTAFSTARVMCAKLRSKRLYAAVPQHLWGEQHGRRCGLKNVVRGLRRTPGFGVCEEIIGRKWVQNLWSFCAVLAI
jgi:hypothetical protein